MIFQFVLGILISLGVMAPTPHVGIEAWCLVDNTVGTVECNYKTKQECNTYRQEWESCEQNPEPGKKY